MLSSFAIRKGILTVYSDEFIAQVDAPFCKKCYGFECRCAWKEKFQAKGVKRKTTGEMFQELEQRKKSKSMATCVKQFTKKQIKEIKKDTLQPVVTTPIEEEILNAFTVMGCAEKCVWCGLTPVMYFTSTRGMATPQVNMVRVWTDHILDCMHAMTLKKDTRLRLFLLNFGFIRNRFNNAQCHAWHIRFP